MSDNSDNRIRRAATPDGGAVYTVELSADAEAVIARASELPRVQTGGHHSDGAWRLRRRV